MHVRNFPVLPDPLFSALHFACREPSVMAKGESFCSRLSRWQSLMSLGKKEGTAQFHREIVAVIRANLPDIDQISAKMGEQKLSEFALRVSHYCPSRWNCIVSAIRYVTENPKALRYRKLHFKEFTPPTPEEFAALLSECDKAPKSLCGLTVRLLALTGLRINEARQLRWKDVKAERLDLPANITKNGLPRSIPFLPGAKEVLLRLREHATSEFVLTIPSMRTALKKACIRAGLPQMSYHSFRHYFATKCLEAGVDAATVARWLGHQCGGALLSKMYFHLSTSHSVNMASRVQIQI